VFQVAEMTSVDVADVIEKIGLKAMNQIMSGKGISFTLPNRTGTAPRFPTRHQNQTQTPALTPPPLPSPGNHQYIPQLDANFLELKHMVLDLRTPSLQLRPRDPPPQCCPSVFL
jgi:hypothetical protein